MNVNCHTLHTKGIHMFNSKVGILQILENSKKNCPDVMPRNASIRF